MKNVLEISKIDSCPAFILDILLAYNGILFSPKRRYLSLGSKLRNYGFFNLCSFSLFIICYDYNLLFVIFPLFHNDYILLWTMPVHFFINGCSS